MHCFCPISGTEAKDTKTSDGGRDIRKSQRALESGTSGSTGEERFGQASTQSLFTQGGQTKPVSSTIEPFQFRSLTVNSVV